MMFKAPDHIRYKMFAAHLSPELRKSHGVRSLPIRSGDTVRIMRGDHEGFEGKISRVDRKRYRVFVEGLTREKVDGTTIFLPIHPSKVMITSLNLDDKWRKEILKRKKEAPTKAEEVKEKPKKAVAIKEEIVEEKPIPKEEKPKKRKPRAKRKPAAKKAVKAKVKKAEKEEKPKAKKPRTKRKPAKKIETEGGT